MEKNKLKLKYILKILKCSQNYYLSLIDEKKVNKEYQKYKEAINFIKGELLK